MREILFRGKSINDNEWVFGDLIRNLIWDGREKEMRIGDIYFEHNGDIHGTAVYKVIPETVGQFTGLTDRNGKKIFEGDIMQLCSACYPCLVYWDGKSWAWKQNGKRREIDLTREKMDIIGNIFDNPELFGE